MDELGMQRLEEFADAFDLGRTTVYSLFAGRVSTKGTPVKPSVDTLVRLASALETPLHELVYELAPDAYGADAGAELPEPTPVVAVPCRVAGWTTRDQAPNGGIRSSVWIERTYAQGRDLLAFRVQGDSMTSGRTPIKHGDIVLVDRSIEATDSSPVIARLPGDRVVCKLLKIGADDGRRTLMSTNLEHLDGTPTVVHSSDIDGVIGPIVRVIHDIH